MIDGLAVREWLHEVGWLAFFVTVSLWLVTAKLGRKAAPSASGELSHDRRYQSARQTSTNKLVLVEAAPDRSANPSREWPLKLRARFRNDSPESIKVENPRWERWPDPEWPPRVPTALMLRQGARTADQTSLVVNAGGEFSLWVGLDPALRETDVRARHERRQLGMIEFTVTSLAGREDVKVQL
jgi:hypothetical protein